MPSHLAEIAAEANAYVANRDHQSMMEVKEDLLALQAFLADTATMIRTMHGRAAATWPVNPGVTGTVGETLASVLKAVEAAGDIGPAFRALHEADLIRHEQPRTSERMWDVSASPDGGNGQ